VVRFFSSVVPVAKSAAGKWVSRVGASGGGKAYKKSRPGNYYGALVVIVVLGLAATVFARYDYQHPASAAGGTAPTVGTTWYAALSVEACGAKLPYLAANPNSQTGFKVQTSNVVRISPVSAADSGNNATLSQFAAEYPGLIASSTELAIPTAKGTANAATTFRNGQACPAKSKYHGQTGKISYAYWTSFGQKTPTITTDPASIKFVQYLRVTMAFEPANVTPTPPAQQTVNAMVAAAQNPTTSTTAVLTPTTTIKGTTTTTVPSTTTTRSSTTTAPKG
jgi:hypothetical protein